MEMASFHDVKNGFMLCLLGSDKPVIESLQPNAIDQTEALEKQFEGMSDTPFTYSDYEEARHNLIQQVNDSLTETDREFLLSFENGEPDWEKCCAGDLSRYPSVKWKLQNIAKLKRAILKSTRRDWKSYRPSYFRRRDKFLWASCRTDWC